jgi:hypothetical protein
MLGVESLKLLVVKKLRKQFERVQVEVEAYPAIIREVYSTTGTRDKQIRETVVVPTRQHVEALVKDEDFKEVLSEYPDFATDLVASIYNYPQCKVLDVVRAGSRAFIARSTRVSII